MLEWNVFVEDCNAGEIRTYNVFSHRHFRLGCADALHRLGEKALTDETSYNKLVEEIRKELQYWFWSKCEWEIIISGWPDSDKTKKKKVDVYTQIMTNFQRFIDYIWMNRDELTEGE